MNAADVVALNQLANRYAAAVDACDVALFLSVFTSDARLRCYHPDEEEPFGDMRGHAQLASTPNTMRGMHRHTMHMMSSHHVEIDGGTATGHVLCTARHLANDRSHALNVLIRYVDRYVHEDDGWKIADRQIRFLWSERHEVTDSGFARK